MSSSSPKLGPKLGPKLAPKLAIVAGGGDLPLRLAEICQETARSYVIIALKGWAEATVERHPHKWYGVGEQAGLMKFLKEQSVQQVVMAGNVQRPDFKSLKMDWGGAKLLPKVLMAARKGDDALLRVLVENFEANGFTVVGAHDVLTALLIEKGSLGDISPDEEAWADIERARAVVSAMGALDIGQGAVVANGLVLAVEAVEGTDAMLDRVASLRAEVRGTDAARAGVLLKLPKPIQERRIDLPTIGQKTLHGAAKAGLKGIAVAAEGALVIDRNDVAALANELGLFVVGIEESASE